MPSPGVPGEGENRLARFESFLYPFPVHLTNPKIAIVGSGAVGGYYGAMLARRGFEVHFLCRSDYAAVKANGLSVLSPRGDFHLPHVNAYHDPQRMPKVDLVVVAVKTTHNADLPKLIPPLLAEHTSILTLQNGLGNEQFLADHFGAERVMGGMAFLCSNRESPGVIRHLQHGLITVGEFVGPPGDRVAAIARFFNESGVACSALPELSHGRWEKLVWNIPFNGLGAALDLTTDKLINTEPGLRLVRQYMQEVLNVAAALGHHYAADIIERKIAVTREMGAYHTSMHIDRRLGREMELHAIFALPMQAANRVGIQVPYTAALWDQLQAIGAAQVS